MVRYNIKRTNGKKYGYIITSLGQTFLNASHVGISYIGNRTVSTTRTTRTSFSKILEHYCIGKECNRCIS